MAINIIHEKDIYITRAEHDSLIGQYISETRNWYGITPPPSFESWVRDNKNNKPGV